jgi:hypothetical protein
VSPTLLERARTVGVVAATQATLLLTPLADPAWATVGRRVAVALAVVLVLALVCRLGRWRPLPTLLVAGALFVGCSVALYVGRPLLLFFLVKGFQSAGRYLVVPAAMLLLAVVAAIDGVPGRQTRHGLAAAATAVFLWAWTPAFRIPPYVDLDWPRWAAALDRKLAAGSPEALRIPQNPRGMWLDFDPIAMATDAAVPAAGFVGGLGATGTFLQEFVSRCDGLRLVEVALGAAGPSTRGALRFTLHARPRNEVLATVTVPRRALALDGKRQRFYLPEQRRSRDRRYAFALTAEDNDSGMTVYVLGATGDPYPAGGATLGGIPLGRDASFRYGCSRPPWRAVAERTRSPTG